MSRSQSDPPTKYGIVLFPGFQALDAFGPLDILNTLAQTKSISLAIIASTLDPVSTALDPSKQAFGESIVPTHTFASPPADLDVLLVPGGFGTRSEHPRDDAVAFIKAAYPRLHSLISVCTGARFLARAGVLDGRKATTNKSAWTQLRDEFTRTEWVPVARWVVDGNVWTAAGVTAGIDTMFAFVATVHGEEVAQNLANILEYDWHKDPSWDPFAKVWKVPGA